MVADHYLFFGAPGVNRCRVLVVAQGGPAPQVTLTHAAEKHPVTVKEWVGAEKVREALRQRGITLHLGDVAGLRADTEYEVHTEPKARHARAKTRFRTLPESAGDEVEFAITSCNFLGYDDWSRNRAAAAEVRRRLRRRGGFAFHVGDNVYCDVPTPTGPRSIYDRYVDYFTNAEFEEFRLAAPALSTFDDHELWNDFPSRTNHLLWGTGPAEWAAMETAALGCLDAFQASLNPARLGVAEDRSFVFRVDPFDIFALDLRTARTHEQMLPEATLKAFEGWCANLSAPGIVALGQPLWLESRTKGVLGLVYDHNPAHYADQYRRVWDALWSAPYDLLVVSGDVHHSYGLAHMGRGGVVLDVVSSPMAHIPKPVSIQLHWRPEQARAQTHLPSRMPGCFWTTVPKVGTAEPNVIAFLRMKARPAERWEVSVEFVDLLTGKTAKPSKPFARQGASGLLGVLGKRPRREET